MNKIKKPLSLILTLIIASAAFATAAVSVSAQSDAGYKAAFKLKAGEVKWIDKNTKFKNCSSSKKSVATVKDGKITALTKGTAIITATADNGSTNNYKVTVTTNPKITGKKSKAEKNTTFTIKVSGAATAIKYSSTKPKIASINSKGEITTKKVGTTTIKANVNGTTLSFKLKVYVKDIVTHYKATFKKGSTYTLYYSEVGRNPKIVSSNSKIVKVTKSKKLKALKCGKATLTFSHAHAKAIVKVNVVK